MCNRYHYLIRFDKPWPDPVSPDSGALQGNPDVLCELRTDSACTCAIHIHPGKQLLRVLVDPDHGFHLAVTSDADFAVGMASEVGHTVDKLSTAQVNSILSSVTRHLDWFAFAP